MLAFKKMEKTRKAMKHINKNNENPEETFQLDSLNINDRLANSLAKSIKSMPKIISLSLTNTLLSDTGFAILAKVSSKTLKKLDISYNDMLSSKTYRMIAVSFRRLEFLNLERNFIKDEGLKALLSPVIDDKDEVDIED